ncbi:hypothetical protein H4R33_006401 [Dimargaris cristalligena]|nr:hypothetical protein H4R33_006401 [Dimargaris cristalligena]
MYRVGHKYRLPDNPTGEASWSGDYIYPNGWHNQSTSRVVVKESDPTWNILRSPYLSGSAALFSTILLIVGLNSFISIPWNPLPPPIKRHF